MKRRQFIQYGLLSLIATTATTRETLALSQSTGTKKRQLTPAETAGPFYPVIAQQDQDFDLTRIEGQTRQAKGQVIIISGRVIDVDGHPVEGAVVDLWQANAAGRYAHALDARSAPVDPYFQGWAIVSSGKEGRFHFKTIMPGAYPVSSNWTRPPHIHFKISKRGYRDLTTQMYFPNQVLNTVDRLLQNKNIQEQANMIATRLIDTSTDIPHFNYDIVLAKV